MNRLLFIDDNAEIQAVNHEYLTKRGYVVDRAYSGEEALCFLRKKTYDCVVLDVLLPGIDGYALCAEARKTVNTPVIFLSCLDGGDDKLRGLMSGGDDYMTKPYVLAELAGRIYAQIRRDKVLSGQNPDYAQPAPNATYDKGSRVFALSGMNLIVSRSEYEVLSLLIASPDETVEREEIQRIARVDEQSLPVFISRLRSKLQSGVSLGTIETSYGHGYRYVPGDGNGVSL